MARFSTGLRDALASYYGLGLMMNDGIIRVYQGTRPGSPDDPPGATELAQITEADGSGLLVMAVSPGILTKNGTWRLRASGPGTAQWWRWCWADPDPQTQSTYYPRVDGLVGTELILHSDTMYAGLDTTIEQFLFTLGLGT